MKNIINGLMWRYTTKIFDNNIKVKDSDISDIIEIFRLTPSMFGLEPRKLIIIENNELKKKLIPYSYGQIQVGNCSHLLVFTKKNIINDEYITSCMKNLSEVTGFSDDYIKNYKSIIKDYFSKNKKQNWTENQLHIALGNIINSLANKRIDSSCVGLFDSKEYDKLLDLRKKGFSSVIVLAIGYRCKSDKYSSIKKVRFNAKQIVEIIK